MDYDLERKIRLNDKTEHESLYSWCLEELDSEGKKIGRDLIPWHWSFHFTASELRLNQGFEFGELSIFDDDDKDNEEDSEQNFEDSEVITATLHPGICTNGRWLEDDPTFSMFGTNRAITDFSLRIYKVENEKEENCNIWGCVSYTAEVDFRNETSPDNIEIHLGLSEARFNKLADLISSKAVDVVRMGLSRVSGFYSDWSPSISTNSVKVLTRGNEQEIIKPDGCEIEPPRLGRVGKFDLTLITRCKLNPKQNLGTLNISKLFDDDDEYYEDESEVEESEDDITKLLLANVVQNQSQIMKLKTPLWIVVILLGALVLKLWL